MRNLLPSQMKAEEVSGSIAKDVVDAMPNLIATKAPIDKAVAAQ